MIPNALSIEPLIFLAAIFFVIVILPGVLLLEMKVVRRAVRMAIIASILVVTTFLTFRLGLATGRSMAWFHWREQYQQPLVDLSRMHHTLVEAGRTQRVWEVATEFSKENPAEYGREDLFEHGKFRAFVERVDAR